MLTSIIVRFLQTWEHMITVIVVVFMANRRVFRGKLETDCSKSDRSIDLNLEWVKRLTNADDIPTDEHFSSVTQTTQTHRNVITGRPSDQTCPRYRRMVRDEILPRHASREWGGKLNQFFYFCQAFKRTALKQQFSFKRLQICHTPSVIRRSGACRCTAESAVCTLSAQTRDLPR